MVWSTDNFLFVTVVLLAVEWNWNATFTALSTRCLLSLPVQWLLGLVGLRRIHLLGGHLKEKLGSVATVTQSVLTALKDVTPESGHSCRVVSVQQEVYRWKYTVGSKPCKWLDCSTSCNDPGQLIWPMNPNSINKEKQSETIFDGGVSDAWLPHHIQSDCRPKLGEEEMCSLPRKCFGKHTWSEDDIATTAGNVSYSVWRYLFSDKKSVAFHPHLIMKWLFGIQAQVSVMYMFYNGWVDCR